MWAFNHESILTVRLRKRKFLLHKVFRQNFHRHFSQAPTAENQENRDDVDPPKWGNYSGRGSGGSGGNILVIDILITKNQFEKGRLLSIEVLILNL